MKVVEPVFVCFSVMNDDPLYTNQALLTIADMKNIEN